MDSGDIIEDSGGGARDMDEYSTASVDEGTVEWGVDAHESPDENQPDTHQFTLPQAQDQVKSFVDALISECNGCGYTQAGDGSYNVWAPNQWDNISNAPVNTAAKPMDRIVTTTGADGKVTTTHKIPNVKNITPEYALYLAKTTKLKVTCNSLMAAEILIEKFNPKASQLEFDFSNPKLQPFQSQIEQLIIDNTKPPPSHRPH
jgi:hypothetical protein